MLKVVANLGMRRYIFFNSMYVHHAACVAVHVLPKISLTYIQIHLLKLLSFVLVLVCRVLDLLLFDYTKKTA